MDPTLKGIYGQLMDVYKFVGIDWFIRDSYQSPQMQSFLADHPEYINDLRDLGAI